MLGLRLRDRMVMIPYFTYGSVDQTIQESEQSCEGGELWGHICRNSTPSINAFSRHWKKSKRIMHSIVLQSHQTMWDMAPKIVDSISHKSHKS
ncbi:hypothetical protein QJS10_CPA01g00655 [Acorus calamus]|uniref:Uncharacterized protein n=1 Tax=Acorus calamus TaxID=4465 RepID=A0AAV9FN38_ACOCL|nr:hypothetical protein QJS10_CPA01g00655 [Acorus calamus]